MEIKIIKYIQASALIIYSSFFFSIAAYANESSVYMEDFENDNQDSFIAVGVPSGELKDVVVCRVIDRRGNKDGEHALSFSYSRTSNPVPVLYNPKVLVQGFKSIEFRIKSEKKAIWVVSVTDIDHAIFSASKEIAAGSWEKLTFVPKDFKCNDDSPVKKRRLDPDRLTFGYANFDLFSILGKEEANEVLIDDVKIAIESSGPMQKINGDYILNGETKIIKSPTKINGDLKLINGAKLIVDTPKLELNGSIVVVGSTLRMQNGIWIFPQKYKYQHHLIAAQNGRIELVNGFVYTDQNLGGAVFQGGIFRFEDVTSAGQGVTFGTGTGGTLEVIRSHGIGEFVIDNNVNFKVEESNFLLIWLRCERGLKATLQLPQGEFIEKWQSPPELSRSISVEGCRNILWGFIGNPGCDITFKGTKLFAAGIQFMGGIKAKVENIKNNTSYDDFTLDAGGSRLRLVDSVVRAWNFYTNDTSELELRNCLYGESTSFEKSKISVYDSICDGSGGYFGAKDKSRTIFSSGKILCQIVTHGNAEVIIEDSEVRGAMTATEDSSILLVNSEATGPNNQIDKGRIEIRRRSHPEVLNKESVLSDKN